MTDRRRRRKRKKIIFLLPAAGIAAGTAIMTFPYWANEINSMNHDRIISRMEAVYEQYDQNDPLIKELLNQAYMYNESLAGYYDGDQSLIWDYEKQLALEASDVMSYIEIPSINVKMPIYHGTDDDVLSCGVGHLEGTSLPVGGTGSHCVLTAHSGMANMKAFDDLNKLQEGDRFTLTTLGISMEYVVSSTEIVLPEETGSLVIKEGEDLVTLITCTPYGINTHRLLVHGERVTD